MAHALVESGVWPFDGLQIPAHTVRGVDCGVWRGDERAQAMHAMPHPSRAETATQNLHNSSCKHLIRKNGI
jgi:hypothetical protein